MSGPSKKSSHYLVKAKYALIKRLYNELEQLDPHGAEHELLASRIKEEMEAFKKLLGPDPGPVDSN